MKIRTKTARFTNPLYLESGRILEPYEIIYETYGELKFSGNWNPSIFPNPIAISE